MVTYKLPIAIRFFITPSVILHIKGPLYLQRAKLDEETKHRVWIFNGHFCQSGLPPPPNPAPPDLIFQPLRISAPGNPKSGFPSCGRRVN